MLPIEYAVQYMDLRNALRNDPSSEIHRLIATNPVSVIRETYGTQPNVYYIGLDTTDPATCNVLQ